MSQPRSARNAFDLLPARLSHSGLPLALILLLLACGEGSRGATTFAARDSAGVRIVDVSDPARLDVAQWQLEEEPSVTIGGDDSRPGHDLFGVRGAVLLNDGRITVANGGTQEIRFFSEHGVLAGSAGRKGQGPGEFTGLLWLGRLPGDTLLAYDYMQQRLALFTAEGAHIGHIRVTPPHDGSFPEPSGVFADGRMVFVPGFDRNFTRGERRDSVAYTLYARDGAILDTLATLPGREEFFAVFGEGAARSEVPFGRNSFVAVGPALAALGANDDYTLSLHDSDANLVGLIRGRAKPRAVDEAEVRAWKQRRLDRYPPERRAAVQGMFEALPARPTRPAFEGLRVDARNFVWVGAPESGDDSAWRWMVYSPVGEPVARVTTPPGFEILDIAEDRIAGRARDADDRELVLVYQLQRMTS